MDLKDLIQKIKGELNLDLRVLLYEQDPFISELLIDILESSELNYQYVASLKEVLPTLLEKNFIIAILTIEELSEDESNLIKEIKKLNKDLLIYTMVDYHKNFNIGNLFMLGVDEVIFKPFSVGEFKARLWKLLREYYLMKKIERFIVEDALTGVYNRRYFEISLREETYRALRLKYPLTLLMIDLDKFKWYNDHLGHSAGDQALISVGEVLCHSTRMNVDKVCRYGGDEFVVILPYTTYKEAIKVVERIFKNWEILPYKPITLSVGVAQLIDRGDLDKTISDLISRADAAMYKAKKIEGNSYVIDEESLKEWSNEESRNRDLLFQASP
ncbi:MAG: diguanylate cyclase [Caldimicrobium sp.]